MSNQSKNRQLLHNKVATRAAGNVALLGRKRFHQVIANTSSLKDALI